MKRSVFLILMLLSACSHMRRPALCIPEQFSENATFEGARECDSLCLWWDSFQDLQLSQFVSTAVCCNKDLNIAREKILQARANARISLGALFPKIDGFATATRTRNSRTLTDSLFLGGRFMNFFQAGFDAAWEVDIFGKNFNHLESAVYNTAAACMDAYDVQVTLTAEVARTYVAIRSYQEQIITLSRHVGALQEILHLEDVRFSGGLDPMQNVDLAYSLLEQKKANLELIQGAYKSAIYELSLLLGQTPEALTACFDTFGEIPLATTQIPEYFPSELLCRRSDVRSAEYKLKASRATVWAARKELFPTLTLQGFYTWATSFYTRLFRDASRFWSIGPLLTLPLFHGGQIWANIDVQTSLQRQAVFAYEKAVLTALKDCEVALVSLSQEKLRLDSLGEAVKGYREKARLDKVLFTGGLVDLNYYLESELLLFDSEILYTLSKEALMGDLIALYKALGGGWDCSNGRLCQNS